MNEKDRKKFDFTKFSLSDDCEYEPEKEEKETDKKPNKKEPHKKPTIISVKELNNMVNKEETDMNWELFQKYFKFTKPSALLKKLCCTNNTKENKKLVDLIESGLKDLKDEIKEMSENEIEIERPDKMLDLVQEILEFNRQNQEGQGLKLKKTKKLQNKCLVDYQFL